MSKKISQTLNEEFSNPLDISDIIGICKKFSNLEYKIQSQIETILEVGVEDAIKIGMISKASLSEIKEFLISVSNVGLFGDAAEQARDCFELISIYEDHVSIEDRNRNKSLN
jgi:hypothetical protein